ncbi:MAG: LysE family transporter, partial [Lautropia sp.]|nr:LysE family transporter [Lautropia sp.]
MSGYLLSMALFALATSATPGPVNIISAMSGARFGLWRSQPYVQGATLSFVAILLLFGLGLGSVMPIIQRHALLITLAGSAWLLWLAWQITSDRSTLALDGTQDQCPGFIQGFMTQTLNPKAWTVALSAISVHVGPHPDADQRLIVLSLTYYLICALSLSAWALIGAQLS